MLTTALIMAGLALYNVPPQRRPRHFRNRDGFSLDFSDEELRARYRFSRHSIMVISDLVRDDLQRGTRRNHALTVEQQVMVTPKILASGSFLQVVGDTLGLDKGTVSRVVQDTTAALCKRQNEFVKWPRRDAEKNKIKAGNYRIGGFPNVIGAIDGTHIRIQAPTTDEASYVNRKGYHSINVQAVCDADGKFTNINTSWPGNAHDAHIFRTSQVCTHMERTPNWESGILLGDSGYPCRPFIMTPYARPANEDQTRFNRHHARTRCVIERTFGRWKRRFHVLHSEIRMKPEKACIIIMACAILHNIALWMNEPELPEDQEEEMPNVDAVYNGANDGRRIRDHITQMYFTN
ncbi:HARBI1 [Mytilus edulis]|uniref:Putative nuclease HARBI1 n=1 Tax=Mytilus edulis TaxID=6550 RepID=A0A8S3PW80_MYTED|nr:HARBI1 [Mytilus edulis]